MSHRGPLPDDFHAFAVEATDGHLVLVSASREKGVRFHFHATMSAGYRNLFLAHLARLSESIRKVAQANRIPPEPPEGSSPLGWFTFASQQLAKNQGGGTLQFGLVPNR